MFGLGIWELLIVLAIVVLIFGASRLPKLAQGLGDGVRGFRKALGGGGETSSAGPTTDAKNAD